MASPQDCGGLAEQDPPKVAPPPKAAQAEGSSPQDIVFHRLLNECLTPDRQFKVDAQIYKECMYLLGPDQLAKCVSRLIVQEALPFPFKRFFMTDSLSIEQRFETLRRYEGPVFHHTPKIPHTKVVSKAGRFFERFPATYCNAYVVLGTEEDTYETIDILSDFFLEEPRVCSVGYGERHSPMEHWQNAALHNRWLPALLADPAQRVLTSRVLREWLYAKAQPRIVEARQGKPSTYMTLFRQLQPRRVLDVASAWGDRLLAAIAYGVDKYVGVDANPDLAPGYERILEAFVPPDQRHRFQMITAPSENAKLPEGVRYDLILMSPAPFRTETYSNPMDQASNYATYEEWMVRYFFATLRVMWDHLEDNGSVAITILDRTDRANPLHYVEVVQLYLQYKMRSAVMDGVIWWSGSGADVPFWMWRKDPRGHDERRRLEAKELMRKHYAALYQEVVRQEQTGGREQKRRREEEETDPS
eukprot:GGOE01042918.1.p1 GENE.GGOE01042918.1~~GGOE01042918.1.p1  ORF type:complete len:473 (+),score=141.36 GGOE01042918.1:34-1452(+)